MFWVIWRMHPDYDPDEPVGGVEIIYIVDDEAEAALLSLKYRAFMTPTPVVLQHHTELKED